MIAMRNIFALSLAASVAAQQQAFFVSGWFLEGAGVSCTSASNEVLQNAIAVQGCNCDAQGCTSYAPVSGGKWTVNWYLSGANTCTGPTLVSFPSVPADGSCVKANANGASFAVALTAIKPTTLANCPWSSSGVMTGATAQAGPCQCASAIFKYGGNVQTTLTSSTATLTWTAMGAAAQCYAATDGKAYSVTLARRISGSNTFYSGIGGIGIMDLTNMTWALAPTSISNKYRISVGVMQTGGSITCTSTIQSSCL